MGKKYNEEESVGQDQELLKGKKRHLGITAYLALASQDMGSDTHRACFSGISEECC